jgi:peptide/nickel transport system permease protein
VPVDYVLKRFGQALLIIFIAVSINFMIPRLIPGDPIESALSTKIAVSGSQAQDVQRIAAHYRAKFGLDQPLWKQYINYWGDILRGDLGVSLASFPDKVSNKIRSALPWTLGLLLVSTLLAFAVGSILGALLAWPGSPTAIRSLIPGLMLMSAIPYYLLGIVIVFLFAIQFAFLPPGGGFNPILIPRLNLETTLDVLKHSILPAASIVLGSLGFWALGMRGMTVSVLGEDYITFGEAKGLSPRRIFLFYGMRNAMLPQFTSLALNLGLILSGAVLVEIIFSYPGLGQLLFAAIAGKDYFVIQGVVLLLILALAFSLFVVDLLYPLIDPRIRYSRN